MSMRTLQHASPAAHSRLPLRRPHGRKTGSGSPHRTALADGIPSASRTPPASGGVYFEAESVRATPLPAAPRASSRAAADLLTGEVHFAGDRSGPSAAPRPAASLSRRVAQSVASSLEHLGTDYVDSYVLHGPRLTSRLERADAEVWPRWRRNATRRTRLLGLSNVS